MDTEAGGSSVRDEPERDDPEGAEHERAEALREAERLRRDRDKAQRALEKEAARAERDRERAERALEKEAERRRAERERAVRDAEKEATRAQREAAKAALDAAVAQQRASRLVERARQEARAAGLTLDDAAAESGPELPRELAILWRRPAPGRRGPKPGLTLEAITARAIDLADAEGLSAVSMSRLAEALGVTTMALYRYVASKDELLSLMCDAGVGLPPVAADLGGTWRSRLLALCEAQLAIAAVHPWFMQLAQTQTTVGPNRMAWVEAMLAALADTPLDARQRTAVVGELSLFVLTEGRLRAEYVLRERAAAGETVAPLDEEGVQHPALVDYASLLRLLVDPAREPVIAATLDEGGFDDDDEFDGRFGLDLILDGVTALIEREESAGSSASGR